MKAYDFGIIVLLVAAAIGWDMNIAQIFSMADLPVTGMFIFKCIGIFIAPVGSVLGYIGYIG